ncbi:TonB-dependent receptor [Parvularcula dongshanensis]|uniref:Outer membrane receptor protein involved in Fe transport n=1 Tax=Parvularcula dongshanensis TaxID=1173995 RepID=A0A840I745_9PROT|nr:TonB-dependent receptor [Parvularcula dongshanensis]MBB4659928.1 outer membrane receptor protein involved in Fe transport [Parvularcula dongshanensis]
MKRTLLATSGIIALTVPAAASAQIDEIVVTATKREQTLQEVPVAVSVVQEDTIENAQIIDVFDLQTVVPSLRVSQNQSSGNTTFTIRGFGNGANNVGIEPSVGVFIDGVYRSRSASAISDLAQIERIEVLRGPQSTLFGKNASAGVISIVTERPQFDLGGNVELTYGNYDQKIVKAYLTGPLSETVAFSVQGSINGRDGYAENLTNGDDLNERDRWAVRGQLLFEPTDNLTFRAIADYDQLEEACCYTGNLQAGPTTGVIRALGGQVVTGDFYGYDAYYTFTPQNDIENKGLSLQADWDVGPAQITSITAYREKYGQENFDGDFTSLDVIGELSAISNTKTFTQELRVTGETERFGWLAGAFYFNEDVRADSYVAYGADQRAYVTALALQGAGVDITAPGIIPAIQAGSDLGGQNPLTTIEGALGLPRGTFFADGQTFATLFDQDDESLSLFGQLDFDVTDRLTATVGLNYTTDKKDVSLTSYNQDVFSSLNLVQIGGGLIQQQAFATAFQENTGLAPTPDNIALIGQLNPQGLAAIQAGAQAFADANAANAEVNPLLALVPLQFLPPQVEFPNAVEGGQTDDDDLSYTLRLAYDVTDRVNVYGSYATGFKASSWNLTRDSRPFPSDTGALQAADLLPNTTTAALGTYAGTRFAGPEESKVWEVGAKAQFAWGAVNLALFDQTIEGFQSNLFQGTGFVLANAGKQSVQGAEIEVSATPFDRLDVNFAATLLDPEYDRFVGAPGPNGPTDLSGEKPDGISEVSTSTSFTYHQPTPWGEAFLRGEWQYESDTSTADNVPDTVEGREVNLFNASLGLTMDNGFEALLWGRNLFNDEWVQVAFPGTAQAGTYYGYPNAPRTWGVTVRKRF